MEFKIGSKTYSLKYIQDTLGEPNYTEYTIEKLKKMKSADLKKILREEKGFEPPTRWRKDEYIIACLYANYNKCNHIKYSKDENKDFIGFCNKSPSKDDKGNSNSRCEIKGGKQKSTSTRKKPGTPKDMRGNNHALKTGVYYTGKAKIPAEQMEIYENLKERMGVDEEFLSLYPRIAFAINRICFLESQLQYIAEKSGIEYVNDDTTETTYHKEQKQETDEESGKQFTTVKSSSVKKKTMSWEQHYKTSEMIIKMTLDVEKSIKEAKKEQELNGNDDEIIIDMNETWEPISEEDFIEGEENGNTN